MAAEPIKEERKHPRKPTGLLEETVGRRSTGAEFSHRLPKAYGAKLSGKPTPFLFSLPTGRTN